MYATYAVCMHVRNVRMYVFTYVCVRPEFRSERVSPNPYEKRPVFDASFCFRDL